MTYDIVFLKEAHQDILEAVVWYEGRKAGLGDELFIAIEDVKRIIERNPHQYEDKYRGIRKAITKRFPYILYYKVESGNKVLVLAFLHMKRSARFWKARLKNT